MALRCTTPRFEVALGMEPLRGRCPRCSGDVFPPGWWCEDCGLVAFPTLVLDADCEPNGDDEPDDDYT